MHGELFGCYDRSVSDRNQLPDLTYEEISPWRERNKGGRGRGEGKGKGGEFRGRVMNDFRRGLYREIEKRDIEKREYK